MTTLFGFSKGSQIKVENVTKNDAMVCENKTTEDSEIEKTNFYLIFLTLTLEAMILFLLILGTFNLYFLSLSKKNHLGKIH